MRLPESSPARCARPGSRCGPESVPAASCGDAGFCVPIIPILPTVKSWCFWREKQKLGPRGLAHAPVDGTASYPCAQRDARVFFQNFVSNVLPYSRAKMRPQSSRSKCKSGTYLPLALLQTRGRTFGLHFCTRGTRLRRIRLYVRGGFRRRGPLKMMRDPLKRVRGHRKRSCSQFYDREKAGRSQRPLRSGFTEPSPSAQACTRKVRPRFAKVHAEGTSPSLHAGGTSPMCMRLRAHCVAMGKGAFSRPPFGISYRPCVSKGRPCAPRVAGSRKYEGVSHVRTF